MLLSVCSDLFHNNTGITILSSAFKDCTSLIELPSGLLDELTGLSTVSSMLRGCKALLEIPTDFFKYNTYIQYFSNLCYDCYYLRTIPPLLFRYNLRAYDFDCAFYNCFNLLIEKDVFCDDASERGVRFSTSDIYLGSTPRFFKMFYRDTKGSYAIGGTAPQMTDYIITGTANNFQCFVS